LDAKIWEEASRTMTGWFEVIVLAAIAGFVAWRLIATLGTRTGHETPPVDRRSLGDEQPRDIFSGRPVPQRTTAPAEPKQFELPASMDADLQLRLREIADLDPAFDPAGFANGARGAYKIILEHFWNGDADSLKTLLADDAHFGFAQAITVRPAGSKTVNSQLSSILSADITGAELVGATAHITVRFVANIINDGITSTATDDWTFSRHTRSSDPNWLLIATDDTLGA
jgi:predicted lipid-binding transport protein (Tim44 family)